jgi:hypothetical protein
MRGLLSALLDIGAGSFGELGVPDQVLGAVELAPVPVGTHHGADEVGVIGVRGGIVDEIAGLDVVGGRSDCRGSRESDEGGDDLHAGE